QTCFRILLGSVIMAGFHLRADAEPLLFQSSENRVALLELFTSEGCSSCPPAETWLSGLRSVPGLWKEFVPVSFHVDYWDYLGWRDPWGSKAFSERQQAHARNWQSESIYTPGFVLNGQEWRSWARAKNGPQASAIKAGVLQLRTADREHWEVTFSPPGQVADDYEVSAAILANELVSDVKAGENRGRRLKHDFVVVALSGCALKIQKDKAQGEFELRIERKDEPRLMAFAAWVTFRGHLEPLQAVGGWLSVP